MSLSCSYQLMCKCWSFASEDRPAFAYLLQQLEKFEETCASVSDYLVPIRTTNGPINTGNQHFYVNIFFSVTSWSIMMKLHRKHPFNVLTRIPSNFWYPGRILISMATNRKKIGWPSIRFFQVIFIGRKLWPSRAKVKGKKVRWAIQAPLVYNQFLLF